MANWMWVYLITVNNTPYNRMCCQGLRILLFCTGWKLVEILRSKRSFIRQVSPDTFCWKVRCRKACWTWWKKNSLTVAKTWYRPCLLRLDELHTFTVPECNAKHPVMRGHSKYRLIAATALFNRGSTVVKVLCYKSEDPWFDSSWCHWNFFIEIIFPIALWPWGRLSI